MTKKTISRIYFPGVKFSDNVGVTKVDFGNGTKVAWGSHHVTVRAYDKAGNRKACEINVLVYSEKCKIEKPLNGFKSCSSWRNGGIFCTIGCHYGYAVTQKLEKLYLCSASEKWINIRKYADGLARFPDCSRIIGFTELSITGEFSYETKKCLDSAILQGIESKIIQLLQKYVMSSVSACVKGGGCTVGTINIVCDPNILTVKRETLNKYLKAQFDVRVFLKKEATTEDMNATRHEIQALIKHGINMSALSMKIGTYEFKLDTKRGLHIDTIKGICGKGQVYWNEQCVNCPVGYYHNISLNSCQMCPVDSYQEQEGQETCVLCKKGLSTLGLQGARTNKQCRECTDQKGDGGANSQCEQWKEKGNCDKCRPKMFKLCPKTCEFCAASMVQTNPTQSKRQRGINLKAVIPALVVPTVIVLSVVLLVVILLRRKRRIRNNKSLLALDMMIKRKVAIEKPNNDRYKCSVPAQQLHVRFEDKKNKKKTWNKSAEDNKTITNSPHKKPVLKKDKKNADDDLYVKIPLKKPRVTINDKKKKKKDEKKSSSEEISEQVSTSLELQEINAQMDATQV